jgi:hypothetical protein
MAYIKKYSFPFATKFEEDAVLELWEDTTDATVYEFQGVSFQIQYIPSSDDPFEPIYATQLAVTLDVTDDTTGNTSAFIPNLVTLNDRKYLAKLFIGTTSVYTGWTLSDSVSLAFSTGRKELSFNCVDGLAMLKDITFSNGVPVDNNDRFTLLSFILSSLNGIGFPTGLNIISNVSYYAEGMLDRTDGGQYEPFAQTYVFGNSFINNSGSFETLYVILENILKSFGARIIQANNKWSIISINQLAQDSRYFTEYTSAGSVASYGVSTDEFSLQPYTGNTSDFYFIDNSQTKLFKKGYNNIISDNQIEYSGNYMFNGNLKFLDSLGFPLEFVKNTTGSGAVTILPNTNLDTNYVRLDAITSPSSAVFESSSSIFFPDKSRVKVSFEMNNWDLVGTIAAKLRITGSTLTNSYYYSKNKQWVIIVVPGPAIEYYEILNADISKDVPYQFSMTTTAMPANLSVNVGIEIINSYSNTITIGAIKVEMETLFNSVLIESKITNEEAYTLSVDFPLGVPVNMEGYNNYKGFLSDNIGVQLINWYRQETPTQIFDGLAQLVVNQYMNIYQKNIINIDCSLSSLNTSVGIVNGFLPIKIAYDNDPSSINVEDDFYTFGNTTIDIYSDRIQSTLLQINNVNVGGAIIRTTYNNGDAPPALPTVCNCYRLETLNPFLEYEYIDCQGNSIWNRIDYMQPIYVAASNTPEAPGGTVTLVSNSYCSI